MRLWLWLRWWFVGRRRALHAWDVYELREKYLRSLENGTLKLGSKPSAELKNARDEREKAYGAWVTEIKRRP